MKNIVLEVPIRMIMPIWMDKMKDGFVISVTRSISLKCAHSWTVLSTTIHVNILPSSACMQFKVERRRRQQRQQRRW